LTPLFTPLICPLSHFSHEILINGRNNEKINGPLMVNFETPLPQKRNNDENNGLPLSGTCRHGVGTSIMFESPIHHSNGFRAGLCMHLKKKTSAQATTQGVSLLSNKGGQSHKEGNILND